MESNMQKYENYKTQSVRLKKALSSEFYVEAIAIEYAIIEDRMNSICLIAGINTYKKDGQMVPLKTKTNRIRDGRIFNSNKTIRSKVPVSLLDEIDIWRNERNEIIHSLLSANFEDVSFKEIALKGYELQRQICNKSQCVKRYFNNKKGELL